MATYFVQFCCLCVLCTVHNKKKVLILASLQVLKKCYNFKILWTFKLLRFRHSYYKNSRTFALFHTCILSFSNFTLTSMHKTLIRNTTTKPGCTDSHCAWRPCSYSGGWTSAYHWEGPYSIPGQAAWSCGGQSPPPLSKFRKKFIMHSFRFPSPSGWDLCSSGIIRSV